MSSEIEGLSPEEAAAWQAWQESQLAEVDAEVGTPGQRLRAMGVRVFHSTREFGRPRKNGPKEVVLVRRPLGNGFTQVNMGERNGRLDDVAHQNQDHLGVQERYGVLEDAVQVELTRQRNAML